MNPKLKKAIVFLDAKSWLRYVRRPHFSEFNNFYNIEVVEAPFVILSKDFLKNFPSALFNHLRFTAKKRLDERNKIYIVRPTLLFPTSWKEKYSFLKFIDLFMMKIQILSKNERNQEKIIFITSLNQKWIVEKKSIFKYVLDINDEWSMINYRDKEVQTQLEKKIRKLIADVNLVTTVTIKLKEKYFVANKTFYFPNAVDVTHYVPKFDIDTSKIDEPVIDLKTNIRVLEKSKNDNKKFTTDIDFLSNYDNPIVGSISGLSGNWSDFGFMYNVEKLLPEDIVMVSSGNIHKPTDEAFFEEYELYQKNHRMIYLNYVDYSVLPNFLSYLNVGIVMHRMDEFNKHSAPNKIWAYLAMGLPVVSTDFLQESDKTIFEGMVKFAKTPQEYADYICSEVTSDNLEIRKNRRDLAIKNSTRNRAEKITNLMKQNFLMT